MSESVTDLVTNSLYVIALDAACYTVSLGQDVPEQAGRRTTI